MQKRNKVLLVAGGLALAAGAASGTTGIAGKASAAYQCQQAEACLYQHASYSGSVLVVHENTNKSDLAGTTFFNGAPADNQISSIINNSNQPLLVYQHSGYRGWVESIRPHSYYNFDNGGYENDSISALRWVQ